MGSCTVQSSLEFHYPPMIPLNDTTNLLGVGGDQVLLLLITNAAFQVILFSLSPAAPFQESQYTLASKDISTSVSLQNLCIYFAYCHGSVPCPGFPGFRPTFIPT